MATLTYKLLAQVIPGTSVATVYTVPSATQTIIRYVNAINVVGSNVTVSLFQNGSGNVNKIAGGTRLVPANDGTADGSLEYDVFITMQPTNTIQASAGASNAITLDVWGVEIA